MKWSVALPVTTGCMVTSWSRPAFGAALVDP
jgi:hypothetical protein